MDLSSWTLNLSLPITTIADDSLWQIQLIKICRIWSPFSGKWANLYTKSKLKNGRNETTSAWREGRWTNNFGGRLLWSNIHDKTRGFYLERSWPASCRSSTFCMASAISWLDLASFVDNKTHKKYDAMYKVVGAGTEPRKRSTTRLCRKCNKVELIFLLNSNNSKNERKVQPNLPPDGQRWWNWEAIFLLIEDWNAESERR